MTPGNFILCCESWAYSQYILGSSLHNGSFTAPKDLDFVRVGEYFSYRLLSGQPDFSVISKTDFYTQYLRPAYIDAGAALPLGYFSAGVKSMVDLSAHFARFGFSDWASLVFDSGSQGGVLPDAFPTTVYVYPFEGAEL